MIWLYHSIISTIRFAYGRQKANTSDRTWSLLSGIPETVSTAVPYSSGKSVKPKISSFSGRQINIVF